MSQMCSSSSHQLVAAAIAFRRARRKFPKNFGQLSWPDYQRKESKSEQLSSMKTCKKCEERLACSQEIRNVRSNDVWPSFASSWSSDPRATRSMRENNSLIRRRKQPGLTTTTTTTSCGGCACRRICRTTKRNVVVSFREDGKSNTRCSAGDGAGGRSSVETISCRNCQIQKKTSDFCSGEKGEYFEGTRGKIFKSQPKIIKHRSCLPQSSTRNDDLDLLYDRSCRKNSVSFLDREVDDNSSPEEGDGSLDFPSKLHEWETRAREDSIGPGRVIVGEETIGNCDCAKKHEEARSESHRSRRHQHRHHSQPICHENGPHEDLLLKPAVSRASSSKESSRLCKDCALGQCSRNPVAVDEDGDAEKEEDEEEEEEHRSGRVEDDACAIKHKDSMDLLVEKFKNKKTTGCCSDDETIFKSDEDSTTRTKINEKTISNGILEKEHCWLDYEELQNQDSNCCKNHKNSIIKDKTKFHNRTKAKNLSSRHIQSRCCCSTRDNSCRHVL